MKGRILNPDIEKVGITEGGKPPQLNKKIKTSMIEAVRWVNNRPDLYLTSFVKNLEQVYNNFELPYLLERLYQYGCVDTDDKLKLQEAQSKNTYKPDLLELFDLPIDKAELFFRYRYLEYVLNRHKNDKDMAAKDSGLTKSAFEGRLRTTKKKLK